MDGSNNPSDSTPLPYTSSPLELVGSELKLIKDILLHYPASIPGVLQPFWSWNSEDELCLLNPKNVKSLLLHAILIVSQSLFLGALIYALIIPVPVGAYVAGVAIALILNFYFCKLLNGDGTPQTSTTDLSSYPRHDNECWIFINGVSVGRDWFQSNLNTLSRIFRRPIIGVHNITYGIIFDTLECLIQRDSNYATADIRTGYAQVKKSLLDDKHEKVVLIVHSQGGIEGGAILDWLLDDLPATKLAKLEIYTFASAANHFNNPSRSTRTNAKTNLGVIKHIEHYTNHGDFVARFGILGFIRLPSKARNGRRANINGDNSSSSSINSDLIAKSKPLDKDEAKDDNRFKGRLFKRNATGHMLNQHYLSCMFKQEAYTLPNGTVAERVAEHNAFMDTEASVWDGRVDAMNLGWARWLLWGREKKEQEEKRWECMVREDGVDLSRDGVVRPRDLSRLWRYRNGMTPDDPVEDEHECGQDEDTALSNGVDASLS